MPRTFNEAKKAYQVDTSTSGTTYIRYDSADTGWIKRIVEDDNGIMITVAFGSWANRANLAYSPNGSTLDVD